MESIVIMIATVVVFILGLSIGYRVAKGDEPIKIPKKEDVPFTKENKKISKKLKELTETAEYIENFGKDDY